jgi:O-antigen/teichoic acid export membrane protein
MDNPTPNKNDQQENKSWREERWERRQARRAALGGSGRAGALIIGLLLVVFGAVFLLQNFGNYTIPFNNWGILFLLIPVVALFDRAYRIYRKNGNQLTPPARGAAFFGLILLAVTVIVLFNLNWALWGPLLIILVGIGVLISTILPNRKD